MKVIVPMSKSPHPLKTMINLVQNKDVPETEAIITVDLK